jgi:hypothetical protein
MPAISLPRGSIERGFRASFEAGPQLELPNLRRPPESLPPAAQATSAPRLAAQPRLAGSVECASPRDVHPDGKFSPMEEPLAGHVMRITIERISGVGP